MKKMMFLIFIMPILLCSQNIDQNLERSGKIFVGTPFKLHITLETSVGDSIFSPRYDSLDVFFLKGDPIQTETYENDKIITNVTLTFQAFDTGEYHFPELEFLVKKGDDKKILNTREFLVIVESVVPDSAQVIQDIADPVDLKLSFWDYSLIVLIVIFIFLLIYIIRWLIRKSHKEDIIPEKKDTRPAYEKALELLKSIDFEALINSGNYVEYYYKLSIVLRYFLEINYRFNALEMTTSEIRLKLKTKDHNEKNAVLSLLSEADRAKFAKYIPESNSARSQLTWLKEYLNSFKLVKKEIDNA